LIWVCAASAIVSLTGVADFSGGDEPSLLCALHLSAHRWVQCSGQARDLGAAHVPVGVADLLSTL
jgi:hypothetical protein